ncbi:MAG: HAD-IA family hydrolase [Clostridia bacterium]|nr:HAD-IA family hydrolase [Clostridia bacterium]
MKYELCVFDLDGTLVDTIGDLSDAMNAALARCGYAPKTEREIAAIVGHSVVYMCQQALPEADFDKWRMLMREYDAYYDAHCCDRSRPYEGMPRTLQTLKNAGLRLAVVSNKPHAHAMKVLGALFPKDCFSMILGQMEKYPIKPDPASLRFVLDYFKTPPDKAVYVGDSDVDVAFAKNAGVDCIAVSWGLRGRRALEAAGAERIIDDAGELVELLVLP